MTKLLEKAFAEAAALSPTQRDAFAEWLLAELHAEHRWDQAFDGSGDALARLADEALRDDEAGRTRKLDADEL